MFGDRFRGTDATHLQRSNEIDVEKGKRHQRTTEHDDEIQNVGVDHPIDGVATQRADPEHLARDVGTSADFDLLVLEEPRYVVQQ